MLVIINVDTDIKGDVIVKLGTVLTHATEALGIIVLLIIVGFQFIVFSFEHPSLTDVNFTIYVPPQGGGTDNEALFAVNVPLKNA